MPIHVRAVPPYWMTSDQETVKIYHGNVTDVLRGLKTQSVHCVVTSPPYWGLRSYLEDGHDSKHQEIGSEKTPQEFVATMVEVFREVRRVLRDDGVLWLNLGDSYGGAGGGGDVKSGFNERYFGKKFENDKQSESAGSWPKDGGTSGLRSGNLVGVPWRVALALQADGWVLRQDIIWCLSGGTWVYARTQKGDMPMTLKDLYRLKPSTVKLWNGNKWTQLKGMSKSPRCGDERTLVLRSGERISCTPTHRFPVKDRGLVESKDIRVGDVLEGCRLPAPKEPRDPSHVGLDAAWLAGLYIAEGSGVTRDRKDKFSLSGHVNEVSRWEFVKKIAEDYGGSATLTVDGNNQTIRVYGKLICAVIRELVSGVDAYDKGFSPVVWRYGNDFLEAMLDGYLSGDGSDGGVRWRLGFTRNANLERDLRTVCARLGYCLTLNPCVGIYKGKPRKGYKGEIRKARSGHWNEKDRLEVVEVRKAKSRYVYELGVEDEPHLLALASGVLTHNSKPSPMPESVRNRCTKAHEYVFLLTKGMDYFYDAEAIKEPADTANLPPRTLAPKQASTEFDGKVSHNEDHASAVLGRVPNRNKRSVWLISAGGYPGAHFATFPPKLIEPCILAGTSAKGACGFCGTPWQRVTEEKKLKRERPNDYVKRTGEEGTGNSCANSVAGVEVKTVGWKPGCHCGYDYDVVPCVVMDPFCGSGTTCEVSIDHGRHSVGIDLSERYLRCNAVPRIEGALYKYPAYRHLIPKRK
jgi:DNA modification methylase